jgi:hemerythrin-like domain-containing protein
VELVRKHIPKESSALLPLIEEILSETDRLQMAEQFHELETAILGSSRLEAFLAGVRELSRKYSLERVWQFPLRRGQGAYASSYRADPP